MRLPSGCPVRPPPLTLTPCIKSYLYLPCVSACGQQIGARQWACVSHVATMLISLPLDRTGHCIRVCQMCSCLSWRVRLVNLGFRDSRGHCFAAALSRRLHSLLRDHAVSAQPAHQP